jgi:hypothetical protein
MMPSATTSKADSVPLCSDLAHLQGEWLTMEGRRPGDLLISGRNYILRFMDRTFYKGTFELFPDQIPQAMLMHIEEGPPKHQGKSAWCLYALDLGLLRWCPTEPGSQERLTAFPSLDDTRYLHTVFRRDIIDLD